MVHPQGYPRGYHQILDEDYPDVFQLWVDAVNADFDAYYLHEEGKTKEAEEMWKLHEELWAEYEFAAKIVLTGDEEAEW